MRVTGEQFLVLTYGVAYDKRLMDALYSVLCNGRDPGDVAADQGVGVEWLVCASQALLVFHEMILSAYLVVEPKRVERD